MRKTSVVAAACAYLALVIVFTYPLVANLHIRLPADLGDPLFNIWVVNWNIHSLLNDPANIFNANLFHPYGNVLAYSDLMIVPALIGLVFHVLFGNPIVTYNATFIVLMVFAATAMYLLVGHLTRSGFAAFVAGVLYAFSAYRFAEAGHLQLMTDGFIPLAFLFAHRYLEKPTTRRLMLVVVMVVLQAFSAWYYAIYLVLALVLFFAVMVGGKKLRLDRSVLISFTLSVLLLAILIFPVALPYWQLNRTMPGFTRTFAEAAYFAAQPSDYLVSMPQNAIVGPLSRRMLRDRERVLFPGIATLLFAGVAVIGAARASGKNGFRINTVSYGALAGVAMVLSFGPYYVFHGRLIPLPFALFFRYVPGFRAMRVPARLGLLVLFGLVVIAGYGVSLTVDWLRRPGKHSKGVVAAAAGIAAVLTYGQVFWMMPLSDAIQSGDRIPPVYKWLANHREPEVIVELPFDGSASRYAYFSTYHWKRTVNGYSGYTPPINEDVVKEIGAFPSPRSMLALRALDVEGVLVHSPSARLVERAARTPGVRLVKRFGLDYLYGIEQRTVPAATGALRLSATADEKSVGNEQVTVTLRVQNITDGYVTVPPRLQPMLVADARGIVLDRRLSRLPLVMSPRERRDILLVLPASVAGFKTVRLTFESPVVANKTTRVGLDGP